MSGFMGVGAGLEGSEETVACERSIVPPSASVQHCWVLVLKGCLQLEHRQRPWIQTPGPKTEKEREDFLGSF